MGACHDRPWQSVIEGEPRKGCSGAERRRDAGVTSEEKTHAEHVGSRDEGEVGHRYRWVDQAASEERREPQGRPAVARTRPMNAAMVTARVTLERTFSPSRSVPIETMPLAMTHAKEPGSNVAIARDANPVGTEGIWSRARWSSGKDSVAPRSSEAGTGGLMSIADTDAPPTAPARSGLVRSGCHATAVDDEGPPQVPHRIAPGMNEATERPHGDDGPRRSGMDLVDERGVCDGRRVWVTRKEASEPQRDALAVVVAAAEQPDPDGLGDPEHDDDRQQDEGNPVDGAGGCTHARDEE